MNFSRTQLIITVSLIVVLVGGLAVGLFLVSRQESQSTETSAAEVDRPNAFATIPAFPDENTNNLPQNPTPAPKNSPDYNGDGRVDQNDETLFMQKYQASDPAADLDNSGSVNSLDLSAFKSLLQ